MRIPETFDEIFTDPNADLGEDIAIPEGFDVAAEHTTIFGLHGVLSYAEEVMLKRSAVDGTRWIVTTRTIMQNAEIDMLKTLASEKRSKAWTSTATPQQQRTIDDKETYAVEKVIRRMGKKLQRQPDEFIKALMKTYWGSGEIEVYQPDYPDGSPEYRQMKQLLQSRNPLQYTGKPLEEVWEKVSPAMDAEANLYKRRDHLAAAGFVTAITTEYQRALDRGERYSHGLYVYGYKNAGVTYMLLRAGVPENNIGPLPLRLQDDDDEGCKEIANEDQTESSNAIIPLQELTPDAITRSILKRRLGLELSVADRTEAAMTLKLLDVPFLLHRNHPDTPMFRHIIRFTQTIAGFTESEAADLYKQSNGMNYIQEGRLFIEAFNDKVHQLKMDIAEERRASATASQEVG